MSLPSSGSKNPVLGVIRCLYCNEAATVHETKRRGHHKYTICPSCGIDQKTGKPFQDYIAANMVDSVDRLPETAPPLGLQTEVEPNFEPKPTEVKPNSVDQTEPNPNQKTTEFKPKNTPIMLGVATVIILLLGGLVTLFRSKKVSSN